MFRALACHLRAPLEQMGAARIDAVAAPMQRRPALTLEHLQDMQPIGPPSPVFKKTKHHNHSIYH
jgi:hypothetical protein